MLWINFLHLYQPANIEKEKIEEATKMSYERIVRALEEHPEVKFTLNIAGCLVARWDEEFNYHELIKRIKKLIDRGQVELVGSAAYHALLPLVGEREAIRQVKENEAILKKYFGPRLRLKGFFFPEMAVNHRTARLVKKLGYKWIIIDEIANNGKLNQVDFSKKYADQISGLQLVFRNRTISESYVPETVFNLMKIDTEIDTVISASDAELYGLRHIDHLADFEKLLKQKDLRTLTISEYLKNLRSKQQIKLVESSWVSSEMEIRRKEPFILWFNKKNKIHKQLWKLADLAQELNDKFPQDANHYWSSWHLSRGLASCVFWWASGKDFREVFGPISWSPDEIERGINELTRSIRALENSTSTGSKLKAEKLALEVKKLIWQKHWQFYKR